MARVVCIILFCFLAACRADTLSKRLTRLAIDAAAGDSDARYNLAVELYRGDSLKRDYTTAATLWRGAMEQGNVNAMNNYAFLLFQGWGVKADPERAVALWHRAALRGEVESQLHLGYAALIGKGASRDTVEAVARFRTTIKLAEQSRDSIDGVNAADARGQLAAIPALAAGDAKRADSLAREYARVPSRVRH